MKPLLKAETYTSGSLPHEPVITIKTWQERFDEEFSYLGTVGEMDIIKQFISTLLEEQRIETFKMIRDDLLKQIPLDMKRLRKVIKDYYKE